MFPRGCGTRSCVDWWKEFESVSSSSQANEVKELRRDSVRSSSKGLLGEVILDSGFLILDWRRDCSRKAPTEPGQRSEGRKGGILFGNAKCGIRNLKIEKTGKRLFTAGLKGEEIKDVTIKVYIPLIYIVNTGL